MSLNLKNFYLILQFIFIIHPIFSMHLKLPLTENGKYDINKFCGKTVKRKAKIVGGEEAFKGEYPWVINLRFKDRPESINCGGVLISEQFILTAAHCLAGKPASRFSIRLGSFYSLNVAEEGAIEVPMIRYYIHENFVPNTYANDIALIKIKPINFTDQILPICLPSNTITNYDNILGVVAGWGRLEADLPLKSPTALQKVEVPIINKERCESWFRENRHHLTFSQGQFCAGYANGGRDACYGDSGSPYMYRNRQVENRMEVLGLVSAGIKCAQPKIPGVYTKVIHYIDWVKTHMARLS